MRRLAFLVLAGCAKHAAPVAEQPLRWDFQHARTMTFHYAQRMGASTSLDVPPTLDTTVHGAMDVMAKGDGTANVLLHDLKMTVGGTEEPAMPPAVLPGVHEDGSSPESSIEDPRMLLLKVLVPLPHRILAPGQSDDVPLGFPIAVDGKNLVARGGAHVTLRGYGDEGGQRCAILDAVTDVARLEMPAEQRAKYDASLHGTSTIWFSLADRSLQKATVTLTMTTRQPQKDHPELPQRARLDTELTVTRKAQ